MYLNNYNYDPDQDPRFCFASEEIKNKALEENNKAIERFYEGLDLYNNGRYDDAKITFLWALDVAHDKALIADCEKKYDQCNERLAELYMR